MFRGLGVQGGGGLPGSGLKGSGCRFWGSRLIEVGVEAFGLQDREEGAGCNLALLLAWRLLQAFNNGDASDVLKMCEELVVTSPYNFTI